MIEIRTPARLHLGLLDTNGERGRLFGSIGLAIRRPGVVLQAAPAGSLIVEGLEAERVAGYAHCFLKHYGLPQAARLKLVENIPAHIGLGSGTQLALAVGAALAHLHGLQPPTAEIAQVMGRGLHSGIGINTFVNGGFILDGGQRTGAPAKSAPHAGQGAPSIAVPAVPPALVHHDVPENWWFVVIVPEVEKGLSGEQETKAFRVLPKAPPERVEKVCWLVLMKMLPALIEEDIDVFGQALTEIQQLVGQNFAAVQGGQFANPLSERLIRFLIDQGAAGAGQSSWGPTVYGLVNGEAAAQKLALAAREYLATIGAGQVFAVQPDNHGARLETVRG